MKKLIILLMTLQMTTTAFAIDQVVKEETTPPPAAEAITPSQLQPLITGAKALPKPATPAAQPAPQKSAENDQQIYMMGQAADTLNG